MARGAKKTTSAGYETKQDIQARISALQNARQQTNDIVLEHAESYFRTLATAPEKPVEAFAAFNAISAKETEFIKNTFCADCKCFNDVLNVREAHRLEVAALEEKLQDAPDAESTESGDA